MARVVAMGVIVAAWSVGRADAEMLDQMVAVVNDEVVTQRDLDEAINPYRQQLEEQYSGDELVQRLEELHRAMLETLIEDRLILSEAKRLELPVTDEEVEERMQEVRRQFDSDRAFEVAMAAEGVTMERLRQIYRSQVLTRKAVELEVRRRVTVQPAEIAAYYQEHISQFQKPARVHVSNILIRIGDGVDAAQAKAKAEEILAKLQTGAAFGELAKEYSQGPRAEEGGDLGFVPVGHMLPALEAVIAQVEPGGFAPVIETEAGCYIVMVHERKHEEAPPLEEVQQQIEQLLRRQKFEERLQTWLQKLRGKAYISMPEWAGAS